MKLNIIIACALVVILGAVVGYHNATVSNASESGFNAGYQAAYTKVTADQLAQSERITSGVNTIVATHVNDMRLSMLQEKEKLNEIHAKILTQDVYRNGNCHSVDGIGLLNDQINARHNRAEGNAASSAR